MVRRVRLAGILLLALGVRVAALFGASELPSFRHHRLDAAIYHANGQAIAAGDWALGTEVFHMSPGYSYFVGVVYLGLGDGPWALRIVQLLLGLATVALIWDAARRLFGEPWATAAGLVAALYGPLVFYESQILVPALGAFLHALLFWCALRAIEGGGAGRWALTGVVLGLSGVTRPNALLLGLPLAIAAWGAARRWPALAALGLGAALTVAPVTLRNAVVAGEPVLVTDSGGFNFFIGNGKGAIGTFRVPKAVASAKSAQEQFAAFRAVAEEYEGRALTAREVDAFWYRHAMRRITRDPGGWLKLMGEKLWLYWNGRELANTEDYAFGRLLNPVLALPLVQFAVIAPFALIGTAILFARRRREERLLGGTNLVLCLGVVAFFVLGHYRMLAVPALILAAVAGARALHDEVRAGRWRRVGLIGAALAAATALAFAPKFPKPFDDEWFKLGYAWHVQGRPDEAERAYLRALAINERNLSARKNLAVLHGQLGRPDRARAEWEVLLRHAEEAGQTRYVDTARRHLAALDRAGGGPAPPEPLGPDPGGD